jgi:hypothetical protein
MIGSSYPAGDDASFIRANVLLVYGGSAIADRSEAVFSAAGISWEYN